MHENILTQKRDSIDAELPDTKDMLAMTHLYLNNEKRQHSGGREDFRERYKRDIIQ